MVLTQEWNRGGPRVRKSAYPCAPRLGDDMGILAGRTESDDWADAIGKLRLSFSISISGFHNLGDQQRLLFLAASDSGHIDPGPKLRSLN